MYTIVSFFARIAKRILPQGAVNALRPAYHTWVSAFSAWFYRHPASHMIVLGVTGTKGKSTTCDMLFEILKRSGKSVALASTIRFAINDESSPNKFKMTMQGRGFLQSFLAKARRKGVHYAIVEITSEGVLESRHKFLALNGLIVTNIQKDHIERHGSFEAYVAAKRAIVTELEYSKKKNRVLIVNGDNEYTKKFIENANVEIKEDFSEKELPAYGITLPIPGIFNELNALASIKLLGHFGVNEKDARDILKTMPPVAGRVERIDAGQPFKVVVDYAHTPDSLRALYGAFPNERKICVLGNTGGGRDTWKRPEMGAIADVECAEVILTNEDPYDENPEKIVTDMEAGMKRKPHLEMDRRKAIAYAFEKARPGDVVLISGKGTDPYIMGAHGSRLEWSDANVAKEELERLMKKTVHPVR